MKQLNDQYFTYRQTPVDYDGVARPSIKGNTLCWNQLHDPAILTGGTTGGVTRTQTSGGLLTLNGTATSVAIISLSNTDMSVISGHKYLLKTSTPLGYQCLQFFNVDTNSNAQAFGNADVIYTATSSFTARTRFISTTGVTYDKSTYINIFDLTVMFGPGNEPTIEEFKSLYSLNYYAYGQYLLNFNGTGIKTVGKNLLNNVRTGSTTNQNVTCAVNEDKSCYVTSTGASAAGVFNLVSSNVNDGVLFPSGTYTVSGAKDGVSSLSVITIQVSKLVNGSLTQIQRSKYPITFTLDDPTYIAIRLYYTSGSVIDETVYPILRYSSTPVFEYEPYTSSTLSLPISTYFPTGMKSAGSGTNKKQDEIANGKAITRIGTRAYQSGDESDSTVTTDGTNTNYALSTPTEQTAEEILYNFYGNGTEQLLPVNNDTPSTSPLLADIIYYNLTDSEVPYRVFWAINSKGERWDFTEREFKSFMNNPQGLGFSKTFSVNRYGNAQSLTDITDNFPQPNGEVLFYDSHNSTRYDKYNQFVKFLSYEPITLYYKIPVSFYSRIPNTYSLECVVGTLSKTESKTDHMLTCSINYNALSFYKGEEVEISGTGTSYTINNDSDFPIGFEITINGTSMVNPYFTLEQDNELYGEAKFTDSTAFSSVYVNSNDGEQNVELQQGGSVLPNPLSYQDLSISNGSIYVTFVKLARGESTLTIGKDSGSITGVDIVFTPIYRSV